MKLQGKCIVICFLVLFFMPRYASSLTWSDDFNRADSSSLGNGWMECDECTGYPGDAQLNISGNKLQLFRQKLGDQYTNAPCGFPWSSRYIASEMISATIDVDYTPNSDARLNTHIALSDGTQDNMIGLFLARSSWSYNNSNWGLFKVISGTWTILAISSSPPWQLDGDAVKHTQVTINSDGSIYASVTQYGITDSLLSVSTTWPTGMNSILLAETDGISFNSLSGNYYSYWDDLSVTANVASTPEPATILLLGVGLIGLAWGRRKFS